MKDWQKAIYYVSGEDDASVKTSPFLEKLKSKDLEVLYMTDPLDEYMLQQVPDYEGKTMQSISKEGLKFGDEDEETVAKRGKLYEEKFTPLTKALKKLYGEKVSKIVISQRVVESPAVIVTSQWGYSANMQRILRAQTLGNAGEGGMDFMNQKIMEVNPRHPIVVKLQELLVEENAEEEEVQNEQVADMCWLLYDSAMTKSGFPIEDESVFGDRIHRVLKSSMGLSSMELEPEIEIPVEEEEEAVMEDDDDEEEEEDLDEDTKDEL